MSKIKNIIGGNVYPANIMRQKDEDPILKMTLAQKMRILSQPYDDYEDLICFIYDSACEGYNHVMIEPEELTNNMIRKLINDGFHVWEYEDYIVVDWEIY